jgi:hypothetical protein
MKKFHYYGAMMRKQITAGIMECVSNVSIIYIRDAIFKGLFFLPLLLPVNPRLKLA